MNFIRQGFYLLLGFTFPGFWIFHASGFWSVLYRPIQMITGSEGTGWPSFITAGLVYLSMTIVFEYCYRLRNYSGGCK